MSFPAPFKSVVAGAATTFAAAALVFAASSTANASSYDDEVLSQSIPLEYNVSTDCVLTDDFSDWAGVLSGARCHNTANPVGEFVLFGSSSDLYYRFNNVVTNGMTACPDGHGESMWFDDTNPDVSLGHVVCVAESDGSSSIAWTDERTMTLNYVTSDVHTSSELYVWWQSAAV